MDDLRAIKGAYDEGSGLPPPRAFASFNTHAREVMACGSWTQCLKRLHLGLLADRWVAWCLGLMQCPFVDVKGRKGSELSP